MGEQETASVARYPCIKIPGPLRTESKRRRRFSSAGAQQPFFFSSPLSHDEEEDEDTVTHGPSRFLTVRSHYQRLVVGMQAGACASADLEKRARKDNLIAGTNKKGPCGLPCWCVTFRPAGSCLSVRGGGEEPNLTETFRCLRSQTSTEDRRDQKRGRSKREPSASNAIPGSSQRHSSRLSFLF